MPIWVVALVIAALAPTAVRLIADRLERRARERTRALLGTLASRGRSERAISSDRGGDVDGAHGEPEETPPRHG